MTHRAFPFLDFLRYDGASSIIEFGDPLGLSSYVARSPSRLRQTTSLLDTDAAELRLAEVLTRAVVGPVDEKFRECTSTGGRGGGESAGAEREVFESGGGETDGGATARGDAGI